MTTWAEIREDVRLRLKDTNDTRYKWSDVELLMYCRDALRNFSVRFPRRTEVEVEVLAGTATYALPASLVRVNLVVTPERVLRELTLQPGAILAQRPSASSFARGYIDPLKKVHGFTVKEGSLRLYPEPEVDMTVVVHMDELYEEPDEDTDVIQIPSIAHIALKYLICAYAVERDELADGSLRRWATSDDAGVRRDDNPLRPVARDFYRRYENEIRWLRDTEHFALV
jgi:hypothetical protein